MAYDLKLLPFPPRIRAPDFLQENPLGTIPLLVDGEVRMTESAAIIQYLATRSGPSALSVEPGDPAYGAWLNGLHFGEATLTFPQTLVLRYTRLEPEARRNPQVAEDYAKWFMARLRGLEARLIEGGGYYCGGRFTGADISVSYALLLAETLTLSDRFSAAIADYWARMQDRAGFKAAKRAQASETAPS